MQGSLLDQASQRRHMPKRAKRRNTLSLGSNSLQADPTQPQGSLVPGETGPTLGPWGHWYLGLRRACEAAFQFNTDY